MNIIITILFSGLCGLLIGYGLCVIMTASGRFADADAMSAALADVEAENTLLRRKNASLLDEIATLGLTLSATRDREQMLEEISREMNQ